MTGRALTPRDERAPPPTLSEARAQELAMDYAEELLARETKSRRAAWIVTALLIVICAAQAAALALLLPLKEVVPYTIVVDRSTGFVQTVRSVELGALPEDEAVTQALLAQYALARETFDAADLQARYRLVALWSADAARNDYVSAYRADNPTNLAATTPAGTVRRVIVRSVKITDAAADPKRAELELETRQTRPGTDEVTANYRAQVSFRYSGAPMKMEDRLQNPLGFQVVAYRLDAATPLAASAAAINPAPKPDVAAAPPSPPVAKPAPAKPASPPAMPANATAPPPPPPVLEPQP
jgi:type IV secretion system protein VirB8